MKTLHIAIAAALSLASCAGDRAPPPAADAPNTAVAAKPKPKPEAPKPKPYPLETCLVSGDDLDEMDERVSTVHEGQIFEFCCMPCLVKFRKDPDKYVAELAAKTKR
jgi:YHS domain-containing protein